MHSQDSRLGRSGQAVLVSAPVKAKKCEHVAFVVEVRRERGKGCWQNVGSYAAFAPALAAASRHIGAHESSDARVLNAIGMEQVRMVRPTPALSPREHRARYRKALAARYFGAPSFARVRAAGT